jgi:hypothetical protein
VRRFLCLTCPRRVPTIPTTAEESLRAAIENIRIRLQAELDGQLRDLATQQSAALDEIRRASEAQAEDRWSGKVQAVRDEWSGRLEFELASAAAESETRVIAEAARARTEAERTAAESIAELRAELDRTLATEREQLRAEHQQRVDGIQTERERIARELEADQQQVSALTQQVATLTQQVATLSGARETEELAARALERQEQLEVVERLLAAVRAIDAAPTLSAALGSLADGASTVAPRAALFVVSGRQLQPWKASGFGEISTLHAADPEANVLGAAMRSGDAVSTTAASAPVFATLPANRAGLAVPITVGGQAVAVLYADDGVAQESETPASWPEAVQILGLHASAWLAHMTATRAPESIRSGATASGSQAPARVRTVDEPTGGGRGLFGGAA